jgi:hypothetical protein
MRSNDGLRPLPLAHTIRSNAGQRADQRSHCPVGQARTCREHLDRTGRFRTPDRNRHVRIPRWDADRRSQRSSRRSQRWLRSPLHRGQCRLIFPLGCAPLKRETSMSPTEVIAIADELDCKPHASALQFARMLAEHCAQLAGEAQGRGLDAAEAIRTAFHLLASGQSTSP